MAPRILVGLSVVVVANLDKVLGAKKGGGGVNYRPSFDGLYGDLFDGSLGGLLGDSLGNNNKRKSPLSFQTTNYTRMPLCSQNLPLAPTSHGKWVPPGGSELAQALQQMGVTIVFNMNLVKPLSTP